MRIVFMGTPDFAIPSLRILVEHGYPVVGVVTAPDRPAGRGSTLLRATTRINTPISHISEDGCIGFEEHVLCTSKSES